MNNPEAGDLRHITLIMTSLSNGNSDKIPMASIFHIVTPGNSFAYPGINTRKMFISTDLTYVYVLESICCRIRTYFSSVLCL